MGVQRAGAVAFAAIDHHLIAFADKARLDVLHGLAAGFGNGIGKTITLERQPQEPGLLFFCALQTNVFEQAVMVLRDLPEGSIGRRNNGNHLGQRGERHLSTAVLLGHGNTPQAAVGEYVHHLSRYFALAVALGITFE